MTQRMEAHATIRLPLGREEHLCYALRIVSYWLTRTIKPETFRSSALHALIIDPAGQLVLAILAHPHGLSLISVRHLQQTAAPA